LSKGFFTETFPEPNWISRKIAILALAGEYKVPCSPVGDFLLRKGHKGIVELPGDLKNRRGLKFLVERGYVRVLTEKKVVVVRTPWNSTESAGRF